MHLNFLWVFVEKLGVSLLAIVVFLTYAKLLPPQEFGIAVLILSVTQFLAILISTLFEDTMVQKQHAEEVDYDTVFWASAGIAVFFMILSSIGFYYWSTSHEDSRIFYLGVFATLEILATNLIVTYVAQLRREGNFKLLAIRVLTGKVIGSMLGLICVLNHLGAFSIIMQSVSGMCVQALVLFTAVKRIPKFHFNVQYLRDNITFGSLIALRRLSWDALVRLTPLIAGSIGGTALAGIIGFAWRIVELIRSSIAHAVYSYVLPILSRQQRNIEEMAGTYVTVSQLIAFSVTPVFLGIFAVAPSMVAGLFDPKWHSAILPIQLFSLAALLNLYRIATPLCFTALKRPGQLLMVEMVATIITIIAMTQVGVYGAWMFGLLHVARMLAILPLGSRLMKNIMGISIYRQWQPIIKYLLPGLVMFLTLEAIEFIYPLESSLMHMIMQMVVGVAIFGAITYFFFLADIKQWKRRIFSRP